MSWRHWEKDLTIDMKDADAMTTDDDRQTIVALRQVAQHLQETADWLEQTNIKLCPQYSMRLRQHLGGVRDIADEAWMEILP